MTQTSSAQAARPGAWPAQRGAGSPLAPRNWRVASRLIVLVAIPTMLALALTGLRITDAARSAQADRQVGRLAVLGQQVIGLAQAIEDERADTAVYIAGGHQAAGLAALRRQYVITDRWAATIRRRVPQLGGGYPPQTRASADAVLASIAELPGLRRQAAQGQAPALTVISAYSAATAGLFAVNDGMADLSGDSGLITSVRALGALSRMKDQASKQEAILGVALAGGHFGPGGLIALTTAQAQQAGDLASFRNSATPEEIWALTGTLAGPLPRQARALEQRATLAGHGPLALGARAGQQWRAGMSYTVGWMGHAEQQLTESITAYTQALQRRAVRSAIVTASAGLAALALVFLATMIVARSIVRPLRRLEAVALEVAGARLPAEVGALGVAGPRGHPLPVTPIDVRSADEIGQVARAFDLLHREAVRLAGEQARLRASVSVISASFLRRSHSLLERLLRLIDRSELTEDDPDRLASLFQMDHLATRMRRNTDSALVLAGHGTPRHLTEPVTLVDVLRAAISEIDQYDRVVLDIQPGISVSGNAAPDTVHLLAELLENATTFSPKTTQVIVSGYAPRSGGSLIRIADAGQAMPEEDLNQLNWQLAHPRLSDLSAEQHMGLFAVAHLADRHGITVALGTPPDGGTSAEVFLPAALVSQDPEPGTWLSEAGGVVRSGAGTAAEDPLFSAPRFAAGPESAHGAEADTPYAVPLTLGAPLPSPASATSITVTVPEPASAEPAGPEPAGPEPAAAEPAAAEPAGGQAAAAESAEMTRGRRTSAPRGSHRIRATDQGNRSDRSG